MTFAVRTAKQDRVAQITALNARHAHIETHVPSPDDSDAPRYQGHFLVTNQEGWEEAPDTQRFTCASEACAKQCAAILNEARTAGGCWTKTEKQPDDRVKNVWSAVPTATWATWLPSAHAPVEVIAEVHKVLHAAWHEHIKAQRQPAGPAPKAA